MFVSGIFIIPLLGLDWKMGEKNRVFGVLPGNMVWEHKAGRSFYVGAVFRAITNSYRAGQFNGKSYFIRIDDSGLMKNTDLKESYLLQILNYFKYCYTEYFRYIGQTNNKLMFLIPFNQMDAVENDYT